ncbi:hypothetical protein MicloDRAFT_00045840 [Microvirga lotononidis]|uniref:Uncharacterized protein n=1 Tax=Microvirga lotononidis TaxID=864069 RepID=I4YVL5_9HYPH|nr:hypothetical protein MicloDRAFT_00045840 [Microvirga lotononidis]
MGCPPAHHSQPYGISHLDSMQTMHALVLYLPNPHYQFVKCYQRPQEVAPTYYEGPANLPAG